MHLIELIKILGSIYDPLIKINIEITPTNRRRILAKCQYLYDEVKSYKESAGRDSL